MHFPYFELVHVCLLLYNQSHVHVTTLHMTSINYIINIHGCIKKMSEKFSRFNPENMSKKQILLLAARNARA